MVVVNPFCSSLNQICGGGEDTLSVTGAQRSGPNMITYGVEGSTWKVLLAAMGSSDAERSFM